MEGGEIVQISIVGIIVLGAIVWAILKVIAIGKKKDGCNCGSCGQAKDCAAKEIVEKIKDQQNCHDGQSARN